MTQRMSILTYLADTRREEIVEDVNAGRSRLYLAGKYRISLQSVSVLLKHCGVYIDRRAGKRAGPTTLMRDYADDVRRMVAEGHSNDDIATALQATTDSVKRARRMLGLPPQGARHKAPAVGGLLEDVDIAKPITAAEALRHVKQLGIDVRQLLLKLERLEEGLMYYEGGGET